MLLVSGSLRRLTLSTPPPQKKKHNMEHYLQRQLERPRASTNYPSSYSILTSCEVSPPLTSTLGIPNKTWRYFSAKWKLLQYTSEGSLINCLADLYTCLSFILCYVTCSYSRNEDGCSTCEFPHPYDFLVFAFLHTTSLSFPSSPPPLS